VIYKRTILTKTLSNGIRADLVVAMDGSVYRAALMVSGRFVHGPSQPEPLNPPKGDLTHWMGNKPSVGLTSDEADKIVKAVAIENSVITHHKLEEKNLKAGNEPAKKGFLSMLSKFFR
jgi:hypothetical protein